MILIFFPHTRPNVSSHFPLTQAFTTSSSTEELFLFSPGPACRLMTFCGVFHSFVPDCSVSFSLNTNLNQKQTSSRVSASSCPGSESHFFFFFFLALRSDSLKKITTECPCQWHSGFFHSEESLLNICSQNYREEHFLKNNYRYEI